LCISSWPGAVSPAGSGHARSNAWSMPCCIEDNDVRRYEQQGTRADEKQMRR
jgi:hypothetical protein